MKTSVRKTKNAKAQAICVTRFKIMKLYKRICFFIIFTNLLRFSSCSPVNTSECSRSSTWWLVLK